MSQLGQRWAKPMNDMSAIVERLQHQLGKVHLPGGHWSEILDAIRACSAEIEREVDLLRENREQLLAIIELIPVAFFVKDQKSHFFLMNRACERQWGMSFEALRDTDASQFFPPDQMEQFLAKDRAIFEGQEPVEYEEIFWSAEKQANRVGYTFKRPIYDAKGDPQYLVCVTLDITERKSAEEKLQFANILLTTLRDTSPDAILVVDSKQQIISSNRQFVEMWRLPAGLIEAGNDVAVSVAVASSVKDPIEFAERVRYLYEHPESAANDEVETADGRFLDRHTDALRTTDGRYLGRVWFYRDVTDRKLTEAKLARLARLDLLTGLVNRGTFVEALRQAIALAHRSDQNLAVLFLDIDHFKDVNDTLGHPIGDLLLQNVAQRLSAVVRETDTVGRFGGDEFAIVLANIEDPATAVPAHGDCDQTAGQAAAAAALVADKILCSLREPFSIQGNHIRSGTSIGISVCGPGSLDAETMLSQADMALYRAKSEARGTYRFFNEAMDTEIRARVTVGNELREAVTSEQLFILYQPQVNVETGSIVGLEALVRWHHPTRGVVEPGLFIPEAERNGLIVPLGRWVMREACRQMKQWFAAGIAPQLMAVNLSGVQFKRPLELERDIAEIMSECGLPARSLELELTESVLMEASREHNDLLLRFREIGYRLAIDDFGSGYSSLDYLRRYPVDRMKIAQRFIADIGPMPGNNAIVRAALGLARELDIEVVVEGVETSAQLELLTAWGCRTVQGFYFARPLTVPDVTRILRIGKIGRQDETSSPLLNSVA
jgi:diguanylate cyclase (GGDEF)-like protein/PAS domain S-box-containing protein